MDRDVLYQVGRYNTADHDLPRLDRAEFSLRAMASFPSSTWITRADRDRARLYRNAPPCWTGNIGMLEPGIAPRPLRSWYIEVAKSSLQAGPLKGYSLIHLTAILLLPLTSSST